jgi:CubicO group peptidase (beta-lactamase class C family)
MKLTKVILMVGVVSALYACTTSVRTDSHFVDSTKIALDSFLRSKIDELRIPGFAIAVIENGKITYHRMIGYANVEKRLPVTEKTIFEGASMSKSIFAFFVMTYVEEGSLDLDRPLYEYVPYPDISYDERYKKITARMVLSHRSGFPNWRENEPDKTLRIKFDPGTNYEYSGEGYQYLAMALCKIEGTDAKGLEAAFQKRVAKPLGMTHTVFIPDAYAMANRAEPYDEANQWIDWKSSYWFEKSKNVFGAAYSIHSEPIDFSKWMIAVMNQKLLSKKSYAELFKRHSELQGNAMKIYYTLGFNTLDPPYQNVFFHSGHNDGFTCMYVLDTEKDWGFVFFTNSESGDKVGNDLIDFFWDVEDGSSEN